MLTSTILYCLLWPALTLLLVVLFIVLIRLLFLNLQYKQSGYRNASGQSFWRTILDTGNYGRFQTYRELEKLDGDQSLLSNLILPAAGGFTIGIDLLLIHATGVYIFESKNFSGWILGHELDQNWTQVLKSGKKIHFRNPVRQLSGHIRALNRILPDISLEQFHATLVFSERCKLKKLDLTGRAVRVVHRDELNRLIRKDFHDRKAVFSAKQLQTVKARLIQYAQADEAVKAKSVERQTASGN